MRWVAESREQLLMCSGVCEGAWSSVKEATMLISQCAQPLRKPLGSTVWGVCVKPHLRVCEWERRSSPSFEVSSRKQVTQVWVPPLPTGIQTYRSHLLLELLNLCAVGCSWVAVITLPPEAVPTHGPHKSILSFFFTHTFQQVPETASCMCSVL